MFVLALQLYCKILDNKFICIIILYYIIEFKITMLFDKFYIYMV